MNFDLTDTQRLLQDTARRLLQDRYGFEQRKRIIQRPEGYSTELWGEFAELGLLGIQIDSAHGGSGGEFRDVAVILEEFGRALAVEPFLSTVVLGADLIARAGNRSQQEHLLPAVASGNITLALAYGEPTSRYSLERIDTTARLDGGRYVIDGRKAVVLGAESADFLIVTARTERGISLFLLPRNAEGVEIRGYRNIDDRGAAEVALNSVRATPESLIGPPGGALPHLETIIDRAAAGVCCEAIGAMGALNALTLEYLKTRQQFGRPIGKFQSLQHRMADMAMAEHHARSAAILAVEYADAVDPAERSKAISAAKVQIGSSAEIVGRGAIQLHGGIGLTLEYVAGHYFRRLTAIEMMFGDQAHHLDRFAA